MKLYIAIFEDAPDYMVPTIVAHAILGAHLQFQGIHLYKCWLEHSFKKCVVRVNRKEFARIASLPDVYLGHESSVLDGAKVCAIPIPCDGNDLPNVLKFSKLWKPNEYQGEDNG